MADYDSPWKESLDLYFKPFLAFCFPNVHKEIDWAKGYVSRDKELQKLHSESETGRRVVDKLIQAWRKSGNEAWILIHVEVQSHKQTEFPERMFVYHCRLRDCYNRRVVGLAVLGDDRPDWRPDSYRDELWGCWVEFHFPIAKLLDYVDRVEELEQSENPFAVLVLTHLKSLETKSDPSARHAWKFRLIKGLYTRGWSGEQVRNLFKFIDWMLDLPPELDRQLSEQLSSFEEEIHMPYVTSIERLGIEKGIDEGIEKGLMRGIETVLEARFGKSAESVMSEIRQLSHAELLEKILRKASTVERLEDLTCLWAPPDTRGPDDQHVEE